ncbi:MAG: recombinase family protein [Clostridia bacterium]
MQIAYSYARVSSQEQKEKKNSIPEQQRRIEEFSNTNNIQITRKFEDSDSAFHDENRTDFYKMIKLALIERPHFIILDDSSRFARTRQVAINTKKELRSHGINILYASEPNIDPNTVAGFLLESFQESKNEATSIEIAFHTKRGMTGNLHQRDPETGWCYKNGGKAPYGYKRNVLYKGENQKGKPIYKTIWELDEKTFPIARKIIVDMYTTKEMSYTQIRDYLNNHHIKNSNGGVWSTSTISSMLREDRLEEYMGTAIWNKENKSIIGVKYNDKDLWVICENAHPSIISKEELKAVLKRKQKINNTNNNFNQKNDYLLTGNNIEGNYLFVCSECGGHVVGSSTGKKHSKKYCCGNNRYKGTCGCINNWKVDKDWVEEKVISLIQNNYLTNKSIEKNIENTFKEVSNINNIYEKELKNLNNKISTVDNQIHNLLNSIKDGIDPTLVVDEVNRLKIDKENLVIKLSNLKNSMNNKVTIKRKDIEEYFYNFRKLFENSTLNEKKELLTTFVSNILLNQKEHHLEIILYSQGCRLLEQVAGIEPA